VFLAEQVETGRPVALKRILVQDDEHMEIIKREINFLVSLPAFPSALPLGWHCRATTPPQHQHHLIIIFSHGPQKTLSGKEGIVPFLGAASFRKPNRQEVVVLTEFCPRGSVLNLMYQVLTPRAPQSSHHRTRVTYSRCNDNDRGNGTE
jgi:serine/threonine protein kinase